MGPPNVKFRFNLDFSFFLRRKTKFFHFPMGYYANSLPCSGTHLGWPINPKVTTLGRYLARIIKTIFCFNWLSNSPEDLWNITQSNKFLWFLLAMFVRQLTLNTTWPGPLKKHFSQDWFQPLQYFLRRMKYAQLTDERWQLAHMLLWDQVFKK